MIFSSLVIGHIPPMRRKSFTKLAYFLYNRNSFDIAVVKEVEIAEAILFESMHKHLYTNS